MRGGDVFAALLCACLAGPACAEAVHIPYRVALAGVQVGSGALTVEASGGRYRLWLDGVLGAGEGKIASRAKAHTAGSVVRAMLMPDFYSADLNRAGRKRRVALGFANGGVAMVAVLPPVGASSGRTRPPGGLSRGLIDPLSALVIRAASAHVAPLSACGRRQRIFDGVTRYQLRMFPSRSERIVIAGRSLTALVCRAELHSALTATRRSQRWPPPSPGGQQAMVWLARLSVGRLLAPVRIDADLRFGTLSIEATDTQAFSSGLRAASLQ
jgi:hypothetical protein